MVRAILGWTFGGLVLIAVYMILTGKGAQAGADGKQIIIQVIAFVQNAVP